MTKTLPPTATLLEQTAFTHGALRAGARTFERAVECLAFDERASVASALRWFRFYWGSVERHHRRMDEEVFPALAARHPEATEALGAHGVAHDALAAGAMHIESALSQLTHASDPDERAELAGALRLHATTLRAELIEQLALEERTLTDMLGRACPTLAGRANARHRAEGDATAGGAVGAMLARASEPPAPAGSEPPPRPRTPAAVRDAWRARRRARGGATLPERVPELPAVRLPNVRRTRAA